MLRNGLGEAEKRCTRFLNNPKHARIALGMSGNAQEPPAKTRGDQDPTAKNHRFTVSIL